MPRRKPIYGDDASPQQNRSQEQHLEALITTPRQQSMEIPVERIEPNPFQARKTFDNIDELADTIRTQGFTTRLRVRPHPTIPNTFQLVFGERRLQAARMVGLTVVPCDVRDHSDAEMVEIGLAENIQRRDLDPLEEAAALQTMIDERGYTERSLAERIGKDRGYIQNRLALLRAPADVQALLEQRPDAISAARAIAQVPSAEARQPLIEGVRSGSLTHRDVLALIRTETALPPLVSEDRTQPATDSPTRTALDPKAVQREKSLGEQRAERPPSSLARALERDALLLHATIARWRLALPKAKPEERTYIEDAARECIEELQTLVTLIERNKP